jgi:2-phospho-L-lactate guanylyltransferase
VARNSGHFARLLVVSRDDAVLDVAAAAGAATLTETGADLNLALRQGCDQARREGGDAVLILPADLPLLTVADIDLLLVEAATGAGVVLAPSQDGGTNALFLRLPLPIPLCFGPNSFQRHQEVAAAAGLTTTVCTTPSLAFDLDRPEDLAVLWAEGNVLTTCAG